jgi:hypothetical protein
MMSPASVNRRRGGFGGGITYNNIVHITPTTNKAIYCIK